jgi:hypothetical protein
MSWSIVAARLQAFLTPVLNDPTRFHAWLAVASGVPEAIRLGACLAIDLKSGALNPKTVGQVFDLLPLAEPDPVAAFEQAFGLHSLATTLVCSSELHCDYLNPPDHYIRFLTLAEFVTYLVGPTHGVLPDAAGAAWVMKRYFSPGPTGLQTVRQIYAGRKGVVWIASAQEINALVVGRTHDDAATFLNDALGLGKGPGILGAKTELVSIEYPEGFDKAVACRQPCTFDAWWGCSTWYFLSYGKVDGWGRTRSCSGNADELRERVHGSINKLTDEYKASFIGYVTPAIPNRGKLTLAALDRFNIFG